MAEKTNIEWCDATFNPWFGCTKVSSGCDLCYAEALLDKRFGKVMWGPHGERKRTSEAYWQGPHRWNRKARGAKQRPRVFCASLADVFDNQVPVEWRLDLWGLISSTPNLDWLLLTKRPENVAKMLPATYDGNPAFPNVWLGFTAEDQENFDRRWTIVREIPATVRFCSYEPAIGPLRVGPRQNFPGMRVQVKSVNLHWLICGGESGRGHRPLDPEWARQIRDDCNAAGIKFFMKQMAGKRPIPDDLLIREFPNSSQ